MMGFQDKLLYFLLFDLLAILFIIISTASSCVKEENKFSFKRKAMLLIAVFLLEAVAIFYVYKHDTNRLKTAFINNQEIICSSSSKDGYSNIVIKKDMGYKLIDGYIIKDKKAIDSWNCFSLDCEE